MSECLDATRVLVFHPLTDEKFAVIEDGEVSLSDSAGLILLIQQLSGRDD
jgi:hypothetical protein